MYDIEYSKQAQKTLVKIQQKIALSIIKELEKLAKSPKSYKGNWKKMKGSPFWRLRKGKWRVICELIETKLVIHVLKIGSRGDIYK